MKELTSFNGIKFYIDDEDYDDVVKYNWSVRTTRKPHYICTSIYDNGMRLTIYLHRFILGLLPGEKEHVNHIDGNTLNNSKTNLEMCDVLYNNQSFRKKNSNIGCVTSKIIKGKIRYIGRIIIDGHVYTKTSYDKQVAVDWLNDIRQNIKDYYN